MWCELDQSVENHAIDEWRRRLSACVDAEGGHFEHYLIATLKITMSKWQHSKFDKRRWLSVFFCCECKWTKNNSIITEKCYLNLQVRCTHNWGEVVNFTTVGYRISSRLKWYKNYKNWLRLAKVIVRNKMSRFYGSLCTSGVNCPLWRKKW